MTRPVHLLLLALAVSCAATCDHPEARGETTMPDLEAPQPTVLFHSPTGDATVTLEVVATPAAITRGLMFRKSLAPSAGMLFVFPKEADHTFWMKNTFIPLDMIFVSKDRAVVGVVANAEPLTETSRAVGVPSLYVIEVNAGFAQSRGIAVGTTVTFENVRP